MTVSEIKDLAKKLKEEDVEKIKEEIKNKENILKVNTLDEEELMEVLNTLFSILVIEKALEDEIEGIEEIREELQNELMEAYQQYDDYMARYKKEDKKKKKRRWLLDLFMLSEDIKNKKNNLGESNKLINKMQNQINELRKQTSDDNVKEVCKHENRRARDNMIKSRDRGGEVHHECCREKEDLHRGHGRRRHDRDNRREGRREERKVERRSLNSEYLTKVTDLVKVTENTNTQKRT